MCRWLCKFGCNFHCERKCKFLNLNLNKNVNANSYKYIGCEANWFVKARQFLIANSHAVAVAVAVTVSFAFAFIFDANNRQRVATSNTKKYCPLEACKPMFAEEPLVVVISVLFACSNWPNF